MLHNSSVQPKQTDQQLVVCVPVVILYGGLLKLLHWSDEAATMMV